MITAHPRSVLRCGTLIDGSPDAAREDVALVLDGDRIASIEAWHNWAEQNKSVEVRDLRGHTVTPGLIDAHAHLCLGAPRSAAWTAASNDPIGIVAWGLTAATAALCAGVTTVVDVGSPAGLALRVAALIEAGLAAGPRVYGTGPVITTTGGHGADFGVLADDTAAVARAVREIVAGGADLVKIMATGGAISPSSNRRLAQYTEAELRTAVEVAHRLGRLVVAHANATEGITRAVDAGIDVVAHCNWLGPTPGTIEIDTDTVEAMARRGVWIDLNIQGALRDLHQTDGAVHNWPYGTPLPTTRWELLQPLRERGIGLYLTSDAFGPAAGGFTRSLRDALTRWDITAEKLVSLVTATPARALGLDAERGSIAAGQLADLLVLSGDLRSDPDALLRPASVYRSGVEIVSAGRLLPPLAALGSAGEAAAQQDLLDTVFQGTT